MNRGRGTNKIHDVVGLYLNPPERAVVLCVDEKSQIQALAVLPQDVPNAGDGWVVADG